MFITVSIDLLGVDPSETLSCTGKNREHLLMPEPPITQPVDALQSIATLRQ
jgi:hypothetical protein